MKTVWTKGMNAKEKEEIVSSFSSSAFLRNKLTKILNDKIETNRKSSITSDAYESANWAFKQADSIGYQRALYEIISILS